MQPDTLRTLPSPSQIAERITSERNVLKQTGVVLEHLKLISLPPCDCVSQVTSMACQKPPPLPQEVWKAGKGGWWWREMGEERWKIKCVEITSD